MPDSTQATRPAGASSASRDPGRVIVIGAGLAGLSAACHLRAAGHRVTVVEKEAIPGGRNGVIQQDGFTFDSGPTVLTMIDLIDGVLKAVGSSAREALDLVLLDPAYRAVYADGSVLHVRHGHEAMRAEIAEHCGSVDAAAFDEFVAWLRKLYIAEMPHFIDRNLSSPLDLVTRPRAAAQLLRLGAFGRLGPTVGRRFQDERLRRLFTFQAMYAGLAPDDALALYAVITYMDSIEGVWFPRGGMRAVPQALADAAEAAGVEIRYGASVARVLTGPGAGARGGDGAAVAGVQLDDGERIGADAVVSTLDLPTSYRVLTPELNPPRAARSGDYSPSCVVWHVGVEGVPNDAAHHNIHFGHAWSEAFEDLLTAGTLMRDPSRLVTVHSKDDESAAPAGHSTLYVLEPVPNLDIGRIDWARESGPMRERLHGFLDQAGYPTKVVTERLVTPQDWQDQGMAAGTPFALAHTFAQTGPFRPPNLDKRRPGLFFAGSGTTPGVGVPMVLISGRLAAERVGAYLR